MIYIEGYYENGPRVYRIRSTADLVELALRDAQGDGTLLGDEALRRRLSFLAGVVANLVDRVARDDQDKLDLLEMHAYNLTTDPDKEPT